MKQDNLQKLLRKTRLSGIYHLPASGLATLKEAAATLDFACYEANLHESGDIETIIEALGQALGFPEWYGANLDALNDCLTDFSWHDAPGYVIVLSGVDALRADENMFSTLNEVFSNAIEAWRGQDIPFWVFYDLRADGLATLPTLA